MHAQGVAHNKSLLASQCSDDAGERSKIDSHMASGQHPCGLTLGTYCCGACGITCLRLIATRAISGGGRVDNAAVTGVVSCVTFVTNGLFGIQKKLLGSMISHVIPAIFRPEAV